MSIKDWVEHPSPRSMNKGSGWFNELNHVWVDKDKKYCVMSREVICEWGIVTHICIRNQDNTDIPWAEKQRIKNELYGDERAAIEVFPKTSELVDEANMYHLWLLPKGYKLPFTLKGA